MSIKTWGPVLCVAPFLVYAASRLDVGMFISPSKRDGCAFCEERVLERQRFFEGERICAILTHKPVTAGHVLIIPKRHVERFEDLTKEEVTELQECIRKVDVAARKMFHHKDYLLLQKNGKEAGQSVPHVHFHYLPAVSFLSTKFFLTPWLRALGSEELSSLQKSFTDAIRPEKV